MEIFNSIGARLLHVREAMDKTQSDFAAIAAAAGVPGATRQSQAKYEKGLTTPSAAYLSAIAAAGADVLYILTGTRTATHAALSHVHTASEIVGKLGGTKQEQAERAEAVFQQLHQLLPADEQMWLDCYREWEGPVKKRELKRAMGIPATGPDQTASAPSVGNNNQVNSGPGAVQIKGSGNSVAPRPRK